MNTPDLLIALGRTSWQAGVLVLVIFAVQWVFQRQLTARWRAALWLLVVARLVLPFSLESAVSIFNLLPAWNRSNTAGPAVVYAAGTPAESFDPRHIDRPVAPDPAADRLRPESVIGPRPRAVDFRSVPATTTAPPTAVPSRSLDLARISGWTWAFGTWLLGIAVLSAHVLRGFFRFQRQCRKLPTPEDARVQQVLAECAHQLGVRRIPRLRESTDVLTPALFGFLRPILILPTRFLENFDAQETRFVFLHELAHLRRQDILVDWLMTGLQILHWFNPLIWLGFARWRSDREAACDALAIEAVGGNQNREYGQTILHLLEDLTPGARGNALIGILENSGDLRWRIQMIARYRPGRRWGLASTAVAAGLAFVSLTDAETPRPNVVAGPASPPANSRAQAPTNQAIRTVRLGSDPASTKAGARALAYTMVVTVLTPEGKPLAGADVRVSDTDERIAPRVRRLTDSLGRYTLHWEPTPVADPLSFIVSAYHPDHVPGGQMWYVEAGNVYAQLPAEATLRMPRGVSVGGVVQNERGEPLANIQVLMPGLRYLHSRNSANQETSHKMEYWWMPDESTVLATTDRSGRWVSSIFPPEVTKVDLTFVQSRGARRTLRATDQIEARVLIPHDPRAPLSLRRLKELQAVTTMPNLVPVTGVVVDTSGRPVPHALIREGQGRFPPRRTAEFSADAEGRFYRSYRSDTEWIFTASNEGFATASVVVTITPDMPEVRVVLPPIHPWVAQVVDAQDQPVADAMVRVGVRTVTQILDWSGQTDAAGRIVWSNAPNQEVDLDVRSDSRNFTRGVRLTKTGGEQKIVLSAHAVSSARFRIRAQDAVSGQPVSVRSVGISYNGAAKFHPLIETNASDFVLGPEVVNPGANTFFNFSLRLEAAGYESVLTETKYCDLGDQEVVLKFRPIPGSRVVTVLQPDGTPARGAHGWSRALPVSAYSNRFSHDAIEQQGMDHVVADEAGRLVLPTVPAAAPILFVHTNGFFYSTLEQVRQQREVRLEAYGAVFGRVTVAGKPEVGAYVNLRPLQCSPTLGFQLEYSASTAADGSYRFPEVAPGEYLLWQRVVPKKGSWQSTAVDAYQTRLTVLPGQKVTVDILSLGRTVQGRAKPAIAGTQLNWLTDVHFLTLKLPAVPELESVNREDFATLEGYNNALRRRMEATARMPSLSLARTYPLEFAPDGSFQVTGVLPGTYQLNIEVTKPPSRESFRPDAGPELLARLRQEVVIPEGRELLDLGTILVPND